MASWKLYKPLYNKPVYSRIWLVILWDSRLNIAAYRQFLNPTETRQKSKLVVGDNRQMGAYNQMCYNTVRIHAAHGPIVIFRSP